ncbi:hypothetical protein ACPPVO_35220 [Dactylosporangium sp. McL0621]|uniref:hypothetical protein n=1 Tax=Dactylosporangium sp. McL0621 TaxID=3415678 RepID=UPI003CEB42C0
MVKGVAEDVVGLIQRTVVGEQRSSVAHVALLDLGNKLSVADVAPGCQAGPGR